eukprot:scaffold122_cov387-Prasinococcus_capsulatus_cf.AAC.9
MRGGCTTGAGRPGCMIPSLAQAPPALRSWTARVTSMPSRGSIQSWLSAVWHKPPPQARQRTATIDAWPRAQGVHRVQDVVIVREYARSLCQLAVSQSRASTRRGSDSELGNQFNAHMPTSVRAYALGSVPPHECVRILRPGTSSIASLALSAAWPLGARRPGWQTSRCCCSGCTRRETTGVRVEMTLTTSRTTEHHTSAPRVPCP